MPHPSPVLPWPVTRIDADVHGRWLALIRSRQWRTQPPTRWDRVRCGVCGVHFAPGPAGAATFVDDGGVVILRVCGGCAAELTMAQISQVV